MKTFQIILSANIVSFFDKLKKKNFGKTLSQSVAQKRLFMLSEFYYFV